MPSVRRAALLFCAFVAAGLAATAANAGPPAGRGRPQLVGTYQRVARDLVQPDGSLRDVYDDVLVTGTRSYRLKLPQGTDIKGGTPVRVTGRLAADGAGMQVEGVERLGQAVEPATTGTTKVLVILAYWTSPDSVTTAKAKSQILGDDNGWFGEASYGQLGLSGTATPWYQIVGPTGGRCYENHMEIMSRAKTKAAAGGFTLANYDRFIVYFPRCGGDASGVAGWAYQPGTEVWLNGYMDRRVSVHEQGHNYGLPHAHTYSCTSGGVPVTLGGSCGYVEYGDDYDAMGSSNHTAHFSAPAKDSIGWLAGRKRALSSGTTTFTLPPYEVAGSTPLAAVAGTSVASRKYWIEYRQAVGYDNTLPAGATGGVLVHLRDTALPAGDGAFLLDMSPQNPFDAAVIPPGGAWTSPEGVRISVGTVSASGAVVTVNGSAPLPTVPTAPRNVVATGGDGSVRLTWDPPSSNGGATVQSYVVAGSPGGISETVVDGTTATIQDLANGTPYTFTVKARNSVGLSPASAGVSATPAAQLPSVALTSPAAGATVGGTVTLAATATPHPVANAPIEFVSFEVDGQQLDSDGTAPYSVQWDTSWAGDGEHTVTATAYDSSFRYSTTAPVAVTVVTPRPAIAITQPVDNAVITADLVTLQATSTPAPNGGAPIQWVTYELTDGTTIGYAGDAAPHEAQWDASNLNGGFDVVAKVYDSDGRSGTSAPVHVTLQHPVPSVEITSPAEGAAVQGDAVPVTATATPSPVSNNAIDFVEFFADGTTFVGADFEAPFEATWDTGSLIGAHALTAVAHDAGGKTATSAARGVTVDNPLPAVTVTSPADFAVVSGQVAIAATATPHPSGAPVDHVVLTLDGWNQLADVQAPGPYATTWNAALAYGKHTVVATAYDAVGRAGVSAPVTFTVPSPAPTAVFTSPAPGSVVAAGAVNLALAAAPDATTGSPVTFAELVVDGQAVDWVGPSPNGLFETTWYATPGQHVLSATVWDDEGWQGAASETVVTVANKPSVPQEVHATAHTNGTATVTWLTPDDGGSPLTGYVVKTGGVTQQAASSPYVFTGLTNGTTYTFTVAAVNAAGPSAYSAPSNAVIPGVRTSLTIAVTPTTVPYGRAVTATGVLKRLDTGAVFGGRRVYLMACVPGTLTCSAVTSAVTGATTGKVTLTYVPKQHRDLRLRFLTASPYVTSTSAAKRVKVAVTVTSAISRGSMPLGYTVAVSGKVTPAHGGKRVYLQRLTSTGWQNMTYKSLTSTSTVSFAVKPASRATWRYRLWFPGDSDHLGAYSPSRAVTVS